MQWLWTWGGASFGYREGNALWTHDGRHVGRFQGDEIYGPDGSYLGEIMNQNRLITCCAKSAWRRTGFTPLGQRGAVGQQGAYGGLGMYGGYEDFPDPDKL
jgi:hypothetical protein